MSRPITPRNYQAVSMTGQLVTWSDPAPAAAAALVVQADSWPVVAAVTPYAGCGHVFDGLSETGLWPRYLAAIIAPGAVHARAALSHRWQGVPLSGGLTYHELWSADGGVSGNDVIRSPGVLVGGIGYTPELHFQAGPDSITMTGDGANDSPSAPVDRLLELQTSGAPYVEPLYVQGVAGYSLCVTEQISDLEAL